MSEAVSAFVSVFTVSLVVQCARVLTLHLVRRESVCACVCVLCC